MRVRSSRTFVEEEDSFEPIPGIFWDSPYEYPEEPLSGILEGVDYVKHFEDEAAWPVQPDDIADSHLPELWQLRGSGLSVLSRPETLHDLGKAAGQGDGEFAEAFWDHFGIDIEEELERLKSEVRDSDGSKLRALTAQFGTEAFGAYCPWHAYGDSAGTPWGIYMFFEKILDWACLLHASGKYLPEPKPPLSSVFRQLWWLTYRHELFHFHVELFATRLESALRRPIYRPYVEFVRSRVARTPEWWEEALAQAVVIKSRMVKRALGIGAAEMKTYIVPYFRTFPEGYNRFECLNVPGGVAGAHRILSAQIARACITIPVGERTTAISLAKDENRTKDDSVPGYLVLRPAFRSRFQLQTPRLRDTLRHVERFGRVVPGGKGDHYKVEIGGQKIDINIAKTGNTIDLASAKALARAMGIKVFDLNRTNRIGILTSSESNSRNLQ